jgi:hypothetical protein
MSTTDTELAIPSTCQQLGLCIGFSSLLAAIFTYLGSHADQSCVMLLKLLCNSLAADQACEAPEAQPQEPP